MGSNKISQMQIISLGICNVMGTIIMAAYISSVLGNEAWVVGILSFAANLPVIFLYCALTKKYPGMGLLQIIDAVFGIVAGRLISSVYLLFFIILCALNVIEATNFLSFFILPDTSKVLIAAFLVGSCVYSVKKGILPIARMSTIFLILMFTVMLFYGAASLINAKSEYLLPMFSHKPLDYIQATHIAAAVPYGENILLLVLIPEFDKKVRIKKTYLIVACVTSVIMIFVHLREIITIGPMLEFLIRPMYEAARLVHLYGAMSRIESLFALVLTMLTLFKAIMQFYVILYSVKHITGIKSHRHISVMLGMLIVAYCVSTKRTTAMNVYFGKNIMPFVWSFFSFALPLVTLLAALVRSAAARIRSRTQGVRL